MQGTEKALTFFRVFDLAFFAPGVVFSASLCWILSEQLSLPEASLLTAVSVAWILAGLAAIFCSGLAIHSLTWIVRAALLRLPWSRWRAWKERRRKKPPKQGDSERWPPLPLHFPEVICVDLILYFWYLRSTCWNLACAVLVSLATIAFYAAPERQLSGKVQLLLVGMAFVLIAQGWSYDRVVDRSLEQRKGKL